MGFDESPAPIHAGVAKSVPPFGFGQSIDISEDDPNNLDLVDGYVKVSGMKRKWVSLTFFGSFENCVLARRNFAFTVR